MVYQRHGATSREAQDKQVEILNNIFLPGRLSGTGPTPPRCEQEERGPESSRTPVAVRQTLTEETRGNLR